MTQDRTVPADRRDAILDAAYEVFIAYGFRKTSMDDIARAAGISRPALYLGFRNKVDIFRALSLRMMEACTGAARLSFEGDAPFEARLAAAFEVSLFDLLRKVNATPHGIELMGVNEEIAGDIQCEWRDRMTDAVAYGFEQADKRGEVILARYGVSSYDLARIVTDGVEGVVPLIMRGEQVEDRVRTLLRFVARAVSPDLCR